MENCESESELNNINENNLEEIITIKSNIIDTPDNNIVDNNDLIKLCKNIESLEKIHHIEIAKILKTNNVYLNENNNGIFINLTKISSKVYMEMLNYVEFVQKQENDINKDEKLKKNLETIYFKDNKDKLSNNNKLDNAVS